MTDVRSRPAVPGASRASVAFILVTVTLDVFALGLIIPVLPKLVEQFNGGDVGQAAVYFGLMGSVWALMQFIFSPVVGALSDRYGRRPVLLASNAGLGLDYILMASAPTMLWLFVGRVLSGIVAATFSTATAYIADVTPPEQRAAKIGLIGATFGIGFVLGPALGGLFGTFDPRLPFWLAAGLSLANAVYGYFVLPESLPHEHRAPFTIKRASALGAMRLLKSNTELFGLSGVLLLYNLAHAALPSIFVLYAGFRFGWGPWEVGLVLALVGITSAIVQGGLIRPAMQRYGARRTLLIGLASGSIAFLVQGLTTNPIAYCLAVPIFAFWGFISPACQQLITARVGPDEQGQLQGALTSLMAFANLTAPIVFSQIFAFAVAPPSSGALAGAPYVLAGLLLCAGAVLTLRIMPKAT